MAIEKGKRKSPPPPKINTPYGKVEKLSENKIPSLKNPPPPPKKKKSYLLHYVIV